MFGANKKDMSMLSAGKSLTVCGYEIKKMPIGAYIRALDKIQDLPGELMEKCFPGMSVDDILSDLSKLDKSAVANLVTRAIAVVPEYALGVLAELTGIPVERLFEDESIGVDGLARILDAWLEVNRLGEFLALMKGLPRKLAENLKIQIPGYKGSSSAPLASA